MQAATASLGGKIVTLSPEPLGRQTCTSSSQHPQRTSFPNSAYLHSSSLTGVSRKERKVAQAREETACLGKARRPSVVAAASSDGKDDSQAGRQENPFEGKPAKVNGAAKGKGPDGKKKKDEVKPLPSALQAEVDQQWTQSFPTYMQSREEFESTGHWPANQQSAGKPAYDGMLPPCVRTTAYDDDLYAHYSVDGHHSLRKLFMTRLPSTFLHKFCLQGGRKNQVA